MGGADAGSALAALGRAVASDPGNLALLERYVAALVEAGLKARARSLVQKARLTGVQRKSLMAVAEGRAAPRRAREAVAAALGRGEVPAARAAAHRLAAAYPNDPASLNLKGVTDLAAGDPIAASISLRKAVDLDPASSDARANLGLALTRQGRFDAAIDLMRPAVSEDAPEALRVNLASALLRADKPAEALALVAGLAEEEGADADTIAVAAGAHLALGEGAAARQLVDRLPRARKAAIADLVADVLEATDGREAALDWIERLDTGDGDTLGRLAGRIAAWGELAAAEAVARRAIVAAPSQPTGYKIVGIAGRWQADDPAIARMAAFVDDERLAPERRGVFAFALGAARLQVGQHDAAFDALETANRLHRSLVNYDVARDVATFARIAKTWDGETIGALTAGGPEIAPIFIVGMPRSGSTLIETILSRHPGVHALGESPAVHLAARKARPDAASIAAVRAAVGAHLTPPGGKIAVTDKLLANFLHLGAIAAAFPGAHFIESRRDLRAVGLSIFQADLGAAAHPYSLDLAEIGRYGAAYAQLMDHWSDVLGDRLYRLDYERLVSDPAAEVPALLEAVGLPPDASCLGEDPPERRIKTLSVAQARKPVSTSSVDRWRRFEHRLGPLIEALAEGGIVYDRGA